MQNFKFLNCYTSYFFLFLFPTLFTRNLSQILSLNINNSEFNITYSLNDTNGCSPLFSANVSSSVKCLMLCQTTRCANIQYDLNDNNCTIFDPEPSLIKYEAIPGLNLTYMLCKLLF